MNKQNCWEFFKCGREPNGNKVSEMGVCPTCLAKKVNGIHDGKNGGRCCWVVSGTFCEGKIQGIYAAKLPNCIQCEFYKIVESEEGKSRINSMEILLKLK